MLDIRWDGISHEKIVAWTRHGCGPAVTQLLEARLRSVAEALTTSADLVNDTLRRVDGGDWTGTAATVATQAMRTLRDFDDVLGHHGEVNSLAAYGQSDNASWAKANVPDVVDVRAAQLPTGTLADVFNSTVDFQHRQQLAKDAEEQARQVMREYQAMTVERVAALPPLTPAPQVVIDDSVPIGNREDPVPHGESTHGDATPGDTAPPDRRKPSDEPLPTEPQHGGMSSASEPTREVPAAFSSPSELTRHAAADVSSAAVGDPGRQSATDPAGQSSQRQFLPVGTGFPKETPRPGAIIVTTQEPPRGTQVTPVATTTPNKPDDEEHQVKYLVPSSEIFDPENENGLLHDPYRPGSFVAPTAIGNDDDE